MSLKSAEQIYKPMQYPWAYDAWKDQQKVHWLAEEVLMAEDLKDWKTKLSEEEKYFLTQIFRFFTQGDVEVMNVYMKYYPQVLSPVEVTGMLAGIANCEMIHVDAYSYLIDTLGMPETFFSEFMEYQEMSDKHDYLSKFAQEKDDVSVAMTMAAIGGFIEGLQLFASFAMLLNFQRFNKMKGMCQIVAWSIRDESLHVENICKLFHTWTDENIISVNGLEPKIHEMAKTMVMLEDNFIDLTFSKMSGAMQGLTAEETKQYIRFMADRRLAMLGCQPIYGVDKNPLPWVDEIVNGVEHTNFFENRVTEYSKNATEGDWEDAF